MLAYNYPLLGLFWTMLFFFLWIAWIVVLFRVVVDIFRNQETGGWSKALWTLFVILAPFLGVLVYLVVHGDGMGRRDMAVASANEQAFQAYIRQTAGTANTTDELARLAELKSQGHLTDAEFEQQKARVLAG